ncbi:MAG: hypothetical protein HDT35_00670 [Clostridiales bacterium]|nr:hypothetical protein [Clostridiales bacterium]
MVENYVEDENSVSVFVGMCKSEELFEAYWDDEVLAYDFGFCYDEDFAVIKFRELPLKQIDGLFDDAEIFDLDELKRQYPSGLDKAYNAVYVVGNVKYKGVVKEIENEDFGYFNFLGVFTKKKW